MGLGAMSGPQSGDEPRFLLTVLAAVWLMAFVYSFAGLVFIAPEGTGFLRGFNRVQSFLGWQGIAGVVAIGVFGVSRAWAQGTPVRRLGVVPLGLALLLVLGILAVIAWASFSG